jgi:hypothetical protein
MRAALTRRWETARRANLLHWPGLTPANEAPRLTRHPAENSGNRQIATRLYPSLDETWAQVIANGLSCDSAMGDVVDHKSVDRIATATR